MNRERNRLKKKGKKVNLRKDKVLTLNEYRQYTKVKDLMDMLSPRYRRYFGLRVEYFDKRGNPKWESISAPEVVNFKVFKNKRKHKNKDWIIVKRTRIRYGADAVLSFNKKAKIFKVDIFYRTVNLSFYFSVNEIKSLI